PYVSVLITETNQSVITELDGKYSIIANEGEEIQFIFEGFKTVTMIVSESNVLNVTMIEGSIDLSDIVIDEYRNISRATSGCGGIKTYKTKAIEGDPNETSSVSITPEMICRFGYKDIHSRLKEMMISNKFVDYAVGLDISPMEEIPQTSVTILKDVEILTRKDRKSTRLNSSHV